MVNKNGPMVVLLRGIGSMIKMWALVFLEHLRKSAMKVFGTKINRRGFVFSGRENRKGLVMELRCGLMEAIISVILPMELKRVSVLIIGLMVLDIMESGIKMKCLAKAHSHGQMADYSKVILKVE